MKKNQKIRILKSKTILFISCLSLLLFSCDPGQSILIVNNTNTTAIITFIFKPGDNPYKFVEPGQSDTLRIELSNTPEYSYRQYDFGLGGWGVESSFDSLVSAVETISIETSNTNQFFTGEQMVRDFFESRITGRFKDLIEIKLE